MERIKIKQIKKEEKIKAKKGKKIKSPKTKQLWIWSFLWMLVYTC